ncbi:MAG TPA: 2Fe-2S iron-sulfur cluster-binding protein [bacterium]|nr:2Fe-2S iron-sulfur cluster-binding protein [bacterium]
MAKITIDGKQMEVADGTNVLEACISNGVPLEHFCYHSYLPVAGNCRTCMVEIEGPKGPMLTIGCNTKVAEGMVIHTDTPKAKTAQKSALEMLLLDHPLDCPICDKAGECKLQNQYMEYGLYDFRRGVPRYFKGGKDEDIGEHIILDQERCVLCTRCIRFVDEIPKTSELGIVNRGHESVLSIFPGVRLDNPYSGNVTDVCPVGALTLKEFRFKQRVWFLKKADSVCPGCARGCNITVEHNRGKIYRFMPRENAELNKTWICDEGRFSFNHWQENRLEEVRLGHATSNLADGLVQLANMLKDLSPDDVAGIASPAAALEDLYAMKKLFEKRFRVKNLAAPFWGKKGDEDKILKLSDKTPNAQGLNLLGIDTEGKDLLARIEKGDFKVVIMMHNNPFGQDEERAKKVYAKVKAVIVLSVHKTKMAEQGSMVFPVRPFSEKSGTFVNATSRLQKFKQAIEPGNPDILEASLWICRLAKALGIAGFDYEDTPAIFNAMAKEVEALKGLTFRSIPSTGKVLELKPLAPEPFQGIKAQPNVCGKAKV